MTTLAHGAQGYWDEILLLAAFVGPAVALAVVIVIGKLRGDDALDAPAEEGTATQQDHDPG